MARNILSMLMDANLLLAAGLLLEFGRNAMFVGDVVSGLLSWIPAGIGALFIFVAAVLMLWAKFAKKRR